MWERNTNETSVLHECPRCKSFTKVTVECAGACDKCGLMLAVDKGIAKDNERAAKVKNACRKPSTSRMHVAVNFSEKGMRHGRSD